jgi:hypothetical protein
MTTAISAAAASPPLIFAAMVLIPSKFAPPQTGTCHTVQAVTIRRLNFLLPKMSLRPTPCAPASQYDPPPGTHTHQPSSPPITFISPPTISPTPPPAGTFSTPTDPLVHTRTPPPCSHPYRLPAHWHKVCKTGCGRASRAPNRSSPGRVRAVAVREVAACVDDFAAVPVEHRLLREDGE